ncbi:MAG: hypothetical protein ACT4QE_15280 [Anaerolineales bacterium]
MHSIGTRLTGLYTGQRWLTPARPTLELVARVSGVLVLYLVLHSWLRQSAHLAATDYEQPLITLGLVRNVIHYPVALVIVAGVIAVRYRVLAQSWTQLEYGRPLRWVVGLMTGIVTWVFAAYDYNYYFDQAHTIDRLLLVALALAVLWRPIFVLPFLWLLFAIAWQFDYPLQWQLSWTEVDLPLRQLELIGAALVMYLLTLQWRANEIGLLSLSLLAASYWSSGVGKLQLNWLAHPYIHYLLPAGYAHGWLSFLDGETVGMITRPFANFMVPLMLFTLMVELGSLLSLWRHWVTLAWLTGAVMLHTGILLMSGIAFWKWMLLEAALIMAWLMVGKARTAALYTRSHFVLSLILIAGGPLWFKPVSLAWYDTPITYTYRLDGIGASGERYVLPSRMFSLYADMLTFGNFGYLDPQPRIDNLVWGVTMNPATASALVRVETLEELAAAEARYGQMEYDADRARLMDDFLRRFIDHLNHTSGKPTVWPSIQAPGHLWTMARPPVYTGQEPVREIQIVRVTWRYAADHSRPIREVVVRKIMIPSTAT